ncbi:hypothetical protein [Modestobacter sp. SYSU DS0290]
MPETQLEATTHRVETRYALPGPLIQEEALGTSYTFSRGDATVTLRFPRTPRDFYESRESETPYVPALSPEQPRLEGTPRIWALNIMLVVVDIPGFGSMHDKETLPFEDIRDEVEKSWYRGAEISNREITRFMSWLRVETAQSWLGTGDEPSMQYGRSYLRDLEQGGLLIAFGEEQSITMRHGEIGASIENLERIRCRLDADEDVPPELELFADARFFARESDLVDGQRAVLSAAMAAEIATKKAILRQTPAEKRAVVELLLKTKSNVPDLVSDIAKASIERSLKVEDPDLYRQLRELTDLRNQIVHTGRRVDRNTAYRLSFAVEKLIGWLE